MDVFATANGKDEKKPDPDQTQLAVINFSVGPSDGKGMLDQPVDARSTTADHARKKKWALASLVLLGIACCSVLEGQLTAEGFQLPINESIITPDGIIFRSRPRFEAPHFYTFCRFLARTLAFPIVFGGIWLFSCVTRRSFSPKQFFRHCCKPLRSAGTNDATFIGAAKLLALPTIFSVGLAAGMIVSFVYVPPSVSGACFSSVVAISYILSVIFLKLPLLVVKIFFILGSFGGVAMVAYHATQDSLKENAYIGILVVLGAAACLALHQLTYLQSFPSADPGQSALLVSIICGLCALIYWPVPLATKLTGTEIWHWDDIPWGYFLGGVFSSIGTSFLYNYGLALSSPFFMSLGELLNLTAAGVIDHTVRHIQFTGLQIGGFVVVGVSFLVLIVPDNLLSFESMKMFFNRSLRKTDRKTPLSG